MARCINHHHMNIPIYTIHSAQHFSHPDCLIQNGFQVHVAYVSSRAHDNQNGTKIDHIPSFVPHPIMLVLVITVSFYCRSRLWKIPMVLLSW